MADNIVRNEPAEEAVQGGWISDVENQEPGNLGANTPPSESTLWFRTIFNAAPSGIIIVDPERHVSVAENAGDHLG